MQRRRGRDSVETDGDSTELREVDTEVRFQGILKLLMSLPGRSVRT
jgi:hypothetical protein